VGVESQWFLRWQTRRNAPLCGVLEMSDFSKTRYTNVFATPLVTHRWEDGPDLNPLLRERILVHEAESGGIGKSNRGGWHSETGLLEFCGDPGQRLVRHMHELADEATRRLLAEHRQEIRPIRWTLSAWANVNRSGDFNMMHVHPGASWSGTYYVDTGDPVDPERGSSLHLLDPCQGRSLTMPPQVPNSIFINPKPGLMVLFPSYVPHMVFPHNGNSARISIAFNLCRELDI
jgi:uncharacterized protein (TIGR02466 family)